MRMMEAMTRWLTWFLWFLVVGLFMALGEGCTSLEPDRQPVTGALACATQTVTFCGRVQSPGFPYEDCTAWYLDAICESRDQVAADGQDDCVQELLALDCRGARCEVPDICLETWR